MSTARPFNKMPVGSLTALSTGGSAPGVEGELKVSHVLAIGSGISCELVNSPRALLPPPPPPVEREHGTRPRKCQRARQSDAPSIFRPCWVHREVRQKPAPSQMLSVHLCSLQTSQLCMVKECQQYIHILAPFTKQNCWLAEPVLGSILSA